MAVRAANSQRKVKVPLGVLRKAAQSALSSLGSGDAELSLLITGDRKMRALNRAYRGLDRTTDVLSFSISGGSPAKRGAPGKRPAGAKSPSVDGPPAVLGDIVISAPKAKAQADELGHSLEDELLFLLVHGILHLMGYDHEAGVEEKRRMEKKQRELIRLVKEK